MSKKSKWLFGIDWAIHFIIGCIYTIFVISNPNIVPNKWYLATLIFILSIPWEGYYFFMMPSKSLFEKVCLKATYFDAFYMIMVITILGYVSIYYDFPLSIFYWVTLGLSIFTTIYCLSQQITYRKSID
jgi:hypothetical protein